MCEYPHVVVTGASSSTGRAVTLCLAASGFHVYAGVRTHAGGVALHQHTPPDAGLITPLLLDVTRPIQVMAAVRAVTAHTGPDGLAGLVNDAGTHGLAPPGPRSVSPASSPSSGRSCRYCAGLRAASCLSSRAGPGLPRRSRAR